MAAAKLDPNVLAHLEWLGFVRPVGLVVSAPALVRAGAILDRRDTEGQRLLRECAAERAFSAGAVPAPWLPDFQAFATQVLGWDFSPKRFAGTPSAPIPDELQMALADEEELLRPDFAVAEPTPQEGRSPWQLLVQVVEPGEDFDRAVPRKGGSEASAHNRLERLLRQTGVTAGLLFNGGSLRLVSAPRGESSGWVDFHVADMVQTAGRPISSALRLLLSQERLLTLPRATRLTGLLEDSRKYQNEVSERLAEQVLHALYELVRGFQAAQDHSRGELLSDVLREHPDLVYRGLLTVLLRLVFLLYAEERDMLPEDDTFLQNYSLGGLHERLREDAALYPDTMDDRYGAWAQLLVLFRMVHDGAEAGPMRLPRRHGVLFDPDQYKFLEGRHEGGARQKGQRIEPPRVPDGTVYRALEKLLVLDGERISYRALDVEEIGSVYQTMMGFRLETATGRSVAIKSQKRFGAPTTIDLEALLEEVPGKREAWLQKEAERKLSDKVKKAVVAAKNLADLHAALLTVVDREATPDLVPQGAMVLQPSEERRRSGSHYTPRSLTEPIVRTTLEPILKRLRGDDGRAPKPEQILDLKVCDPAMGSGAFLVEACRQLGDALIETWKVHGGRPPIPPDEREDVFAMRMVAQRCLYGVDRNPVAVDLAKVSLWLSTLAKDHAFTFLDHALRHGDSLVGLTRNQIENFHWDSKAAFESPFRKRMREQVAVVAELRRRIREADDMVPDWELRDLWNSAELELSKVRVLGDLALAAFFEGEKAGEREKKRNAFVKAVVTDGGASQREWLRELREAEKPMAPFHWEVEFLEVFDRECPGFDAFVGNPPFAGKNSVVAGNRPGYLRWLRQVHAESHGNSDLVAHFFRRGFGMLRLGGTLGFIATNTVSQGDTRATGLRWICGHGGVIFAVRRRVRWPGLAAVVVSVIHIAKSIFHGSKWLDGREREVITAFLFHRGGNEDPIHLRANKGKSFQGSKPVGMGFTFDDEGNAGVAGTLAEMRALVAAAPPSSERIFPFLGGDEVNESPTHQHRRYIISFDEMTLEEAARWPDLLEWVRNRVRPERMKQKDERIKERWWLFERPRRELYETIGSLKRVLATSQVSKYRSFTFLETGQVFDQRLILVALDTYAAFAVLESQIHELWSLLLGSTMKDDHVYTPSDCFEPFPFPENWEKSKPIEVAGREYFEFRSSLMVRTGDGLTAAYNRFHNPDEQDNDIAHLRYLRAAIDRAVLDAYGWLDIATTCDFFLDYETDDEESAGRMRPYRYRWPEEVRDEVLVRLLELNTERAKSEARAGVAPKAKGKGKSAKKAASGDGPSEPTTGELFS